MIELDRPIRRILPQPIDRRIIVVEIDRAGLHFRVKGTRTRYTLGWGKAFTVAAEIYAVNKLAERRKARLLKRGLKT